MRRGQILTVVRAVSVVLVILAIVAPAIELANHGAFDPTRFFAYFTIQSNLIGVVALRVAHPGAWRRPGRAASSSFVAPRPST